MAAARDPVISPACCHDHPLYYDAATAVRDDVEKLVDKLRRAHALSERYCTLGAKMAAISTELASELVGAASLCEADGLSNALGVQASDEGAEVATQPSQHLAMIAAALVRTALASEMLAAQMRAIVCEPLREVIEDPNGPGAVAGRHAELTAASHALHEALLDTLRPGVGAGSRPRASDISRGAASATFAAKGAARGVGGMFSKLMGQGNVSMIASVASQIDESLGISSLAEPSSAAPVGTAGQSTQPPTREPSARALAAGKGGREAGKEADEDAPPPSADERLVESQLAFAAARLEFELRAREAAHRAREGIVVCARALFFGHLTYVHQAAAALDAAEGPVLRLAAESGSDEERAARRAASARTARARLAALAAAARAARGGAPADGLAVRLPQPLLPYAPRAQHLLWAGRPADSDGADGGAPGGALRVPSLRALAVSLRTDDTPRPSPSARVDCVCGFMHRIVDTPLGKSWKRVWVEMVDGRLYIYRVHSRPDGVTYVSSPVNARAAPSAAEQPPTGASDAATGGAGGAGGALAAGGVLARSPYAEETIDLLTSSARSGRDPLLMHSIEVRQPQSAILLQPPTAAEQRAWLAGLQRGVHARLEQQLKAAHSAAPPGSGAAGAAAAGSAAGGARPAPGAADAHADADADADAGAEAEALVPLLGLSCDDCGAPDAQWASINLAVLLCPDCAGCHRSLGTHVSKVRSLTLDRLDCATLRALAKVHGARAPADARAPALVGPNAVYEARVPASLARPVACTVREQKEVWIRLKYEMREFLPHVPAPAAAEAPAPSDAHAAETRLVRAVETGDMLACLWALLLLRGVPRRADAIARALAIAEASGEAELAELVRQHVVHARPALAAPAAAEPAPAGGAPPLFAAAAQLPRGMPPLPPLPLLAAVDSARSEPIKPAMAAPPESALQPPLTPADVPDMLLAVPSLGVGASAPRSGADAPDALASAQLEAELQVPGLGLAPAPAPAASEPATPPPFS